MVKSKKYLKVENSSKDIEVHELFQGLKG